MRVPDVKKLPERGTIFHPQTATDLLRRWGWVTALVWISASGLLVASAFSGTERAGAWPYWCAVAAGVAAISSIVMALHPRSGRALRFAIGAAVFACTFRAVALLMVQLPDFPDSGKWLGVVLYLGLAQTIVFIGSVFQLAQLGDKTG